MPWKIRDQSMNSSSYVKILGVIFDAGLRYYSHVARACKRGTNAILALNLLKNPWPETTRKLFFSAVASVINYSSIFWVFNSINS